MSNLIELSQEEMNVVSGGKANWGEVGAGLAMIGVSVAIAATPVGLFGMAGAAAFSYFGGTLVGSGLLDSDVWDFDDK